MNVRIIVMLLAALIMSATLADTPIYKWVDRDGHVHYSTVPRSANAQQLNIMNRAANPAPAASTAPPAASASSPDQALTQVSPDDSPACKSAKEILGRYLAASYLYTLGKDDQKQKLPKDQQDKAISRPGTPSPGHARRKGGSHEPGTFSAFPKTAAAHGSGCGHAVTVDIFQLCACR